MSESHRNQNLDNALAVVEVHLDDALARLEVQIRQKIAADKYCYWCNVPVIYPRLQIADRKLYCSRKCLFEELYSRERLEQSLKILEKSNA